MVANAVCLQSFQLCKEGISVFAHQFHPTKLDLNTFFYGFGAAAAQKGEVYSLLIAETVFFLRFLQGCHLFKEKRL